MKKFIMLAFCVAGFIGSKAADPNAYVNIPGHTFFQLGGTRGCTPSSGKCTVDIYVRSGMINIDIHGKRVRAVSPDDQRDPNVILNEVVERIKAGEMFVTID
ncbi:MAG: hypothetical protein EOP52_06205 [Sphingobacteriales bacterium]|nr:MAG: hypothetical protein EOP52_06205 [Sphingobacteriales bacterium]